MSKMKVRYVATIELDTDDWADEYGLPYNTREVRDDIRQHVLALLDEATRDHTHAYLFDNITTNASTT